MKKRILALLLALCLGLGSAPAALARVIVTVPPPSTAETNSAVDDIRKEYPDFRFQDGITDLLEYTGTDSHVVVPEGVIDIFGGAFKDCVNMTSITLPETLEDIGGGDPVFEGCTGLTEITFPDSMTRIYHGTFEKSSLQRIYLPAHLVDTFLLLPENCYVVCKDDVIIDDCVVDNGTLTQYVGQGGRVVVPDGVTNIAKFAFRDRTSVTEVVLPDGLQTIEELAFCDCTALTCVNIPDSVETIGMEAFKGCSSLAEVTVPSSTELKFQLWGYGSANFRGVFPETTKVTLVGHHFDVGNGILKGYNGPGGKVVIPNNVTKLDWNGGYLTSSDRPEGRGSITQVVFPSGLTRLERGAVRSDTATWSTDVLLTDVFIPASVTQIDDEAIISSWDGKRPKALTVHGAAGSQAEAYAQRNGYTFVAEQRLDVVAEEAKEHRFEVENGVLKSYSGPGGEVIVPQGVTELAPDVFKQLGTLESLELPSGIDRVEISSDSLRHISMSNGVETLILKCPQLEELTIPAGITERPRLECPRVRRVTFPKDNWVFKGISRDELLRWLNYNFPELNTIVNCPNPYVEDVIASNAALRDAWLNPSSTLIKQSTRITQLSNQITFHCDTDYEKAKAISQWVVDHIKYDDDYYYAGLKDYSDVPFNPEEILDKGQAVCAGFARLTQALLVAQGIPCLYVTGYAGERHAWNLALIDGEYLWIDNTWGMNYFGLGIYAISKDHTATGAASFNNVTAGPGTVVDLEEQKPDKPQNGQQTGGGQQTGQTGTAINATLPSATGTAYPSTQSVEVDGKSVSFWCYALKDQNGNDTNYIKLRDLADILKGTQAKFQVGWDGDVTITTGQSYTPNGSEGQTPFSGQRTYRKATGQTRVNGQVADLAAFVLNDDQGGGYTYYQLRDLGKALGFNVGWSAQRGIFLETDKPYDANN